MQELIDLIGVDAQQGIVTTDQSFVHEIRDNADGCSSGSFSGPRLEHVEMAFFDGKLKILNFLEILLQVLADSIQLLIDLWKFSLHLCNGLGGADTRHHIFALSIDEIFSIEHIFPGTRIPRKAYPSQRLGSHVAEYHRLHRDRGS